MYLAVQRGGEANKNPFPFSHLRTAFSILSLSLLLALLSFISPATPSGMVVQAKKVRSGISLENGLHHERTALPGNSYRGKIILENETAFTQEISFYKRDYRSYADGRVDYGPPGKSSRSNADWIQLETDRLILPAGERMSVKYRVEVPDHPEEGEKKLTGTYWSLVMVEGKKLRENSKEKEAEGKAEITVKSRIRWGVDLVTNIGDSGKRKLELLGVETIERGEAEVLRVKLKNTGQRVLKPQIWVELYRSGDQDSTEKNGKLLGRFGGKRRLVYPGNSISQQIPIGLEPERKSSTSSQQTPNTDKLGGNYRAILIFDCGGSYIWGAQANLEF